MFVRWDYTVLCVFKTMFERWNHVFCMQFYMFMLEIFIHVYFVCNYVFVRQDDAYVC